MNLTHQTLINAGVNVDLDVPLFCSSMVPAQSQCILRTVVGSTVHGTSVAGSDDRDEMAIVIEPPEYVVGLARWESSQIRTQPDGARSMPGDLDLAVHSLRKYCSLAANGNPTILIPLFAPQEFITQMTTVGRTLRGNRDMFISKRCGAAFLGYMHAQLKRLKGEAGGRHGKPRPELIEQYGFDTKYAGHIIRLGLQGLELLSAGVLSLPMLAADREEVIAVRTGKYTEAEVIERAAYLEARLTLLVATSSLPTDPDFERINQFLKGEYLWQWHQRGL